MEILQYHAVSVSLSVSFCGRTVQESLLWLAFLSLLLCFWACWLPVFLTPPAVTTFSLPTLQTMNGYIRRHASLCVSKMCIEHPFPHAFTCVHIYIYVYRCIIYTCFLSNVYAMHVCTCRHVPSRLVCMVLRRRISGSPPPPPPPPPSHLPLSRHTRPAPTDP